MGNACTVLGDSSSTLPDKQTTPRPSDSTYVNNRNPLSKTSASVVPPARRSRENSFASPAQSSTSREENGKQKPRGKVLVTTLPTIVPACMNTSRPQSDNSKEHDELSIVEPAPAPSPSAVVDGMRREIAETLSESAKNIAALQRARNHRNNETPATNGKILLTAFDEYVPQNHKEHQQHQHPHHHILQQRRNPFASTLGTGEPPQPSTGGRRRRTSVNDNFDFDEIHSDDDENCNAQPARTPTAPTANFDLSSSSKVMRQVPTTDISTNVVRLNGKSNAANLNGNTSCTSGFGIPSGSKVMDDKFGSIHSMQGLGSSAAAAGRVARDTRVPSVSSAQFGGTSMIGPHSTSMPLDVSDSVLERSFNANELVPQSRRTVSSASPSGPRGGEGGQSSSATDMELSTYKDSMGGLPQLENSFESYLAEHVRQTIENRRTLWFRNATKPETKKDRLPSKISFIERVDVVHGPSPWQENTDNISPRRRRSLTAFANVKRRCETTLVPSATLHSIQLAKTVGKQSIGEIFSH